MTTRILNALAAMLLCGMAAPGAAQSPPARTPPAQPAPAAAPAATSAQAEAGEPRAQARPSPGGDRGAARNDRVDLDTTMITGNRELPKVMYVVPWKKSDLGDVVGKPMNSLLDEVLAPVDRDEFRREVGYYRALQADQAGNPPNPAPSPHQGEK